MNKKKIIGIGALVVMLAVVILLGALYLVGGEKPVEGSKTITIEVVNSEGKSKKYEVKTDAEFLQQAMDDAKGLEYTGEEGTYGMEVKTVNGESAVYDVDGAYWAFYVNDEYCMFGISEQPVQDGDAFKIEYTLAE